MNLTEELSNDLKTLFENPFMSVQEITKKHGIPRHILYIQFKKLFGTTILELQNQNRLQFYINKYGIEFEQDLHKLRKHPFFTTTDFAKKYNISHQRVSQLIKKFFNISYINIKKEKRSEIKEDTGCKFDPRQRAYVAQGKKGSIVRLQFFSECENLGYDIKTTNSIHGLIVNNKIVVVYINSWMKPFGMHGKYAQFRDLIHPADVHVFGVHDDIGCTFYIVPTDKLINQNSAFFVKDPIKPNIYDTFKERWDLLK